jgi:DnaJ family protein C protein 19
MSAWVYVVGAGAAAFFVRLPHPQTSTLILTPFQGRAALVALRRSGGGAGALGRGFYKGGFEPKMTRREAALILEMPYMFTYFRERAIG